MLIDYDRTFPKPACSLMLDRAETFARKCVWPAILANREPRWRTTAKLEAAAEIAGPGRALQHLGEGKPCVYRVD